MLAYHRRLLAFDHWASLETWAALAPVADRVPRSMAWLAHVMAAKRLWFARVADTTPPFTVNPTLALDEVRAQLLVAHAEWHGYLASRTDADMTAVVPYRNIKGHPFHSTLGDILAHLPVHGQHHRGQIAADLRSAGATPPVIDFIHAARAGLLELLP